MSASRKEKEKTAGFAAVFFLGRLLCMFDHRFQALLILLNGYRYGYPVLWIDMWLESR